MKKLLIILLLGLLLLSFIACSYDDAGGISNTGFPTYIPDPDGDDSITELGFDYFFTIRKSYDRYYEVEVLSLVEPINYSLYLNGQEMSFEWDHEDYFWWFSLEGDELQGIDFGAGDTILYSFYINRKEYIGELEILDELIINWPEFNFDEDFVFTWNISNVPNIYNIWFDLLDSNFVTIIEKNWQIDGSLTEFAISDSLYGEYADDIYRIWIDINAITYINHGKCLAWMETDKDFCGYINSYKKINRHERLERILEIFSHNK